MPIENILALTATLFSLIIFLQLGFSASRRVKDSKSFLFAGRGISGTYFQHTLVASGTSLATVLVFFLTTGRMYGIVFLINLLTFILGQYWFFRLAERSDADLQKFTTLSEFVGTRTKSRILFWIVRIITLSAFMGVMFIEILLGVTIFDYFVSIPNSELVAFLLISVLMLSYIALGGFAAVVDSDSWQFKLMIAGAISLLVFILFFYKPEGEWSIADALRPSAGLPAVVTLILNATLVNFTLPLCQLSSWQRVAAVGNWETVRQNFTKGLWKIIFVWGAFIIFSWGISGSSTEIGSVGGLFDLLRGHGPVVAYILYPVVFMGLVSALLSTADSAAMAISLEVFYRAEASDREWRFQRGIYVAASATFLFTLGVGFMLFHSHAKQYFVHLVFVLFSQVVVMFPILYALLAKKINFGRLGRRIAGSGMVIAFFTVWGVSIVGMYRSDLAWTQFAAPIGLFIATAMTIWAKGVSK